MKITDLFSLLGGLALFLYGMKMMSDGLENVAGNKLKTILEKLTANRFLGVAVGAVITAVIQSSSATTVMVVGFVNSGLMTLNQAVWIIMGANIGTTITGQLIALDVGVLAPVIAFCGVVMITFLKGKKIKYTGEIIAGLGVLFIGMGMMSGAMIPLRESPTFISLMTNFSNPLLGVLAGMLFTAVIQSSSASVGILQALASGGLIGLGSSVYVLFGQNIGTCITAVLASIGTNRNAKRATLIHLMFNLIGTILFVFICMATPFTDWVISMTPNSPMAQIANVHTIFNITTTLLLLPFGNFLAKLSVRILPDKAEDNVDVMQLLFAKEQNIGTAAIAISQLEKEVNRMLSIAKKNVTMSFEAVLNRDSSRFDEINKNEDYIDYLNTEITRYISKASAVDMPFEDIQSINSMFKMVGNIERIGDHAMNMAEYVPMLIEKDISFTQHTLDEIASMRDVITVALDRFDLTKPVDHTGLLELSAQSEQKIDDLNLAFRQNQINRMKNGACGVEACVIYSEMLTDIERVSDHILNIAEACCQTVLVKS